MAARRFAIGAEPQPDGRTHFRVWAPNAHRVDVVIDGLPVRLDSVQDGYHEGLATASAGTRYAFRLDESADLISDPASRAQPDGPFGPSMVIDPSTFEWSDGEWPGVDASRLVVYEMHIGTFTPEGTWEAARRHFPALVDSGITMLEVMPIADFPGRFGWGYDGVNLFAPTRLYGGPDDLRRFVDEAHRHGLAVILDVVYNHVGPSGAVLERFAADYFAQDDTEWGRAINFDGPTAGPVREFYLTNAAYWIAEYHFDGLRLDATQSIRDRSDDHIIAAIARRAREAAGRRPIWIVAENERQLSAMARPIADGGYGVDALWNDDYHHSAIVALTGRREAYYTDYLGQPQEFVSAAKHGFLYQGQWYRWQDNRRGHPALDLGPASFVAFLENHDQVANSATGARLHQMTSGAKYRALAALTLLGPWTPMLFQGQEFDSSAPFLYFADHEEPLADAVRRGRAEFMSQFPRAALPEVTASLADPGDPETFARCKLNHDERSQHEAASRFHADALRLRRDDPTLAARGAHGFDGAVLSSHAFMLRFFGAPNVASDRLLVVNLGSDLELPVVPEPLLAPPAGHHWVVRWSSEAPEYGGAGVPAVETNPGWRLPAASALVLAAVKEDEN